MPDLRSPLPSSGPSGSTPLEGIAEGRITGAAERTSPVTQIEAFKASLLQRALLLAGSPVPSELLSVPDRLPATLQAPSLAPKTLEAGHGPAQSQESPLRRANTLDPEGGATELQIAAAVDTSRAAKQIVKPEGEREVALENGRGGESEPKTKVPVQPGLPDHVPATQKPSQKESDINLVDMGLGTGATVVENTENQRHPLVRTLPVGELLVQRSISEVVDTFATTFLNEPSRETAHSIKEILKERAEPVALQRGVHIPLSTEPTIHLTTREEALASISGRLREMKSSLEIMNSSSSAEDLRANSSLPGPTPTRAMPLQQTPSSALPLHPSDTPLYPYSARSGTSPRFDLNRSRQKLERSIPPERIRSLIDAMDLGIKRVRLLRILQEIDNALEVGCLSLAGLAALGALGTYHALLALSETASKVALAIRSQDSQFEGTDADLIATLAQEVLGESATTNDVPVEVGCGMVADITGRIVYSGTQIPLEGVVVRGGELGSIRTDKNGTFLFRNIPIGAAFHIEFASAQYDYDTPSIEGTVTTTNHFVVQGKRR